MQITSVDNLSFDGTRYIALVKFERYDFHVPVSVGSDYDLDWGVKFFADCQNGVYGSPTKVQPKQYEVTDNSSNK